MGVALFALLPRVGILEADDMRKLNYMPVFFVAAAVSMGNVLEATKGLDVLTNGSSRWIQPYLTNSVLHHGGHVLGRLRLSFLPGERDFDARHLDPAGDEFRQDAGHVSRCCSA